MTGSRRDYLAGPGYWCSEPKSYLLAYTGGETMRFAFAIASVYVSGGITGVNVGSVHGKPGEDVHEFGHFGRRVNAPAGGRRSHPGRRRLHRDSLSGTAASSRPM